jgi:hypothetical protein
LTEKVMLEWLCGPPDDELMHSYHNVAELRQFRGAFAGQKAGYARDASTQAKGRVSRRCDRPECRDP